MFSAVIGGVLIIATILAGAFSLVAAFMWVIVYFEGKNDGRNGGSYTNISKGYFLVTAYDLGYKNAKNKKLKNWGTEYEKHNRGQR